MIVMVVIQLKAMAKFMIDSPICHIKWKLESCRNEIIVLSDSGGFNSSTLTTLMQSQEICGLQHNLINKQCLQIILVGETVVRLLFTYEVLWLLLINIWLSYYSQCKLVECSTDYMTFAIIFVDTCNFGLSVC